VKKLNLTDLNHENVYVYTRHRPRTRDGLWSQYLFPTFDFKYLGFFDCPTHEDNYSNFRSIHINGSPEGETILIEDLISNIQLPEGKTLYRGEFWSQLNHFIK
jgi:hypothetical protein